jgi:3-hydroxyacyl-CoA dehydrogenase
MEAYTATAEAIDALIEHHLGHPIKEDESASIFALIDLIAGNLGNEVQDEDLASQTWTAEKMKREVTKEYESILT